MYELTQEHEWIGGIFDATPRCPRCQSPQVEPRNLAKKFGGAIGAVTGITSGVALALTGAEVGLLAGPIGAVLGGIAGVIIDGIAGGAAGCAAGSKLGDAIDRNILDNQHCRSCGHTFSNKSS